MRDYSKVSPKFWTDHHGRQWIEPQILGRLKMRIPSHAALRDFIIHRDRHQCRECRSTENLVADHMVSRRNGGRHHPDNMQCLCGSCNTRKASLVDSKVVAHA
jgi:5-methylcytosine-specific restriction endonuclease McrA